ncbi:MAG: ABC transporter permease [Deltaproteobacteria bacterium]|nr:ABC transporter permease [Deltaproteobacteria bacterium]
MAAKTDPSARGKRWRPPTLVVWSFTQLALFLWLLVQMLGVGVVLAIVRRRFHWGAFGLGLATMLVAVAAAGAAFMLAPESLYSWREALLWSVALGGMTVAGFVVGAAGRRVGFWECLLATVIVLLLAYLQLAKGFDVVFGLGPSDSQAYLDYLVATPPGVRFFGSMWDRMLGLFGMIGFLLAVFGGSLGFLLLSEGRFDGSFKFEIAIGLKHLLHGRHGMVSVTAIVAVLGVALGVAALVAVTAVMSGYQEDIQSKILSTNAHFVVQKYGIDFTEYESVVKEGLKHPQVLAASPFTFNEAMLATGERGVGVLIKGVDPKRAGLVTGIDANLCERFSVADGCTYHAAASGPHLPELMAVEDGLPAVVVGSELMKKLGLPVGAPVTLTTPIGIAGARGNAPKRMEFRIGGVFRSGMHDFDARLLYLDLNASQRLMGLGEAVNGVEFRVRDPETVELVAIDIYRAVGRYPYKTLDWRELNGGIFSALKYQKIVMFLVLTFIIIVAAFNIASTLFMAVVEKSREIGVLKSMGARDASVMKIFVFEGFMVGGCGTALGLALGLAVCLAIAEAGISIAADVYMVESLHVRLKVAEVLLTAVAAIIISHLATIFPAINAARQRPVDAMRYE